MPGRLSSSSFKNLVAGSGMPELSLKICVVSSYCLQNRHTSVQAAKNTGTRHRSLRNLDYNQCRYYIKSRSKNLTWETSYSTFSIYIFSNTAIYSHVWTPVPISSHVNSPVFKLSKCPCRSAGPGSNGPVDWDQAWLDLKPLGLQRCTWPWGLRSRDLSVLLSFSAGPWYVLYVTNSNIKYVYIYIKLNYDFVVTFIYSFYFDVFQIDPQHLYPMISHLLSEFDPRHRNDRRHLCLQLLAPTTMTHRYFVLKQLQSYKEIVGTWWETVDRATILNHLSLVVDLCIYVSGCIDFSSLSLQGIHTFLGWWHPASHQ